MSFHRPRSAALLALIAVASPATAPGGPLVSVDVYGTTRLSPETVRRHHDPALTRLAALYGEDTEEVQTLETQIETWIRGRGPFAWVGVSRIEQYTSEFPIQITIDVVEEADAARRMPFREAPDGRRTSPEDARDLLDAWKAYERRAGELFRAGELPAIACEAHHCLWGFRHPELRAYGERFDREVPGQSEALVRVLRYASEPGDRATAAFLLGHVESAQEIVDALLPSIRDPSSWVRNNAMRVLAQISREPGVVIPLGPVLPALDYPTVRDRNKALAIVRNLTGTVENRATLILDAGDTLLALLRLEQAANHNNAHLTLTRLAGRDLGERDYKAWEGWLSEERGKLSAEPAR